MWYWEYLACHGVYPVQIAQSVILTNEIAALGLVTMDMHDVIIYTNLYAVVQAFLSVL